MSFPNTGLAVGAITVNQIQATPINTSLNQISGTSVDPVHDLGIAFGSNGGTISLFRLSTASEVATYATLTTNTANTLSFFSAAGVKVAGAIMNPANQTMLLATADGFEVVNYTNPDAAVLLRSIPSLAVDPTNGVEIMANFGFDPAVPVGGSSHALIITGGNQSGSAPVMTLVDADTGAVYRPDAATNALIIVDPTPPAPSDAYFIDAAAVDTVYHVAVLADRGAGTTFVDLNQLTLDPAAGTYTLPSAAVHRISTYFGRPYLTIESTNHLVMMGGRCSAVGLVVGQLSDPASALGFSREALLRELPAAFDNLGALVNGWFGACQEPHAIGAYLTPSGHPVYTTPTSLGLWLNQGMDHVAVIDLQGLLDGLLSGAPYVPTLTTPQDIVYFDLPKMLSVLKEGTGGGTITSAPSGINCGTSCLAAFDTGTVVTLTATPDATSTFEGWSGDCTGTGSCVVTMSGARSVTATFARIQYVLSVQTIGTGSGTVTSSPPGLIDCPVTCVASLDALTVVTLTAAPTAPSTFAGWSGGGCAGTGTCVVTMDAAKTVTARFSTPPVANDQTVSTPEDTPRPITLTASDADSDPLTYSIVTGPTHGTLSVVTGTNVTYTPTANYNGPDSFTFVANDGAGNSNTATVSLTVTSVSDTPVANNQSVSTGEDTPLTITLTASDGDVDALTYTVVTTPTNGTLSGTAPNLIYTPAADYTGTDSLSFMANDGSVDSNVATVTITVNAVNDPPVATPQGVTLDEDTSTTIVLTSTDTELDPVTYSIVTPPTHGTLSAVTGTNVTYTPAPNYNGPDSFTFVANDGTSNSNVATVTITVTPVSDTPVANDQAVSTAEDTPLPITLTASDADGNPMTYRIGTQPTNGTLNGTAPNVTYAPTANFTGVDSFTFVANDGTVDSNVATVTITVNAVNDPPVATPQGVTLDEDTFTTIVLTSTDAENDPRIYSVVTGPTQGALSAVTGTNVTYTPAANYNGPDSFTFVANDGTSNSNVSTVTIIVTSVNDPPDALDDAATVAEDSGATPIDVLANDTAAPDAGETLTITGVSQGTNGGTVAFTAISVSYTPAADFTGTDTFTYTISDGNGGSDTATVSITVTGANDPPVANNQSVSMAEDTPLAITLTATDTEGDPLTYSIATGPANGTLSGTPPNVIYTPNVNFNGADSFTFVANDSLANSNTATVTITVTPVNDGPVANNQSGSTAEDTPLAITLTATDLDGNPLTYSIMASPTNGTLSAVTGNTATYTPNANFSGADSFTFVANDGTVDSNIATVSITVTGANDPPVANNQSVSTPEDTPLSITLTATDTDGDPLTYSIVTGPTNGTLSAITGNTATYTPALNNTGADSFTFMANDGLANSNTATVTITVTPVNDVPVANNQFVSTAEDTPLAITLTATDVEGNPLTYSIVTGPTNGTLSGAAPNVIYTPAADYAGPDSFTFMANDGTIDSNVATVTITVNAINDPPVATPQSVTLDEDSFTTIVLTATDTETDPFTYSIVTPPTNGTVSAVTGTNVTYTPAANYNGQDSFTFVANDGTSNSNVATVTITVSPVSDPPVANAQAVSTGEDTALPITLTATDADGQSLTYRIDTSPTNGTLSGTLPNVTYTPAANYTGPDSFTFVGNDGTVDSNVATVTITVNTVNDPPVATPQGVTLDEDTFTTIVLTATDTENDLLTYSIVTPPTNGTVSAVTGTNVTYTPAPNYNGPDNFTLVANDGTSNSNVATVTINVTSVNDPPVANAGPDQTVTATETVALDGSTSSDVDGNPLTFQWSFVSVPTGSAAALSDSASATPTFVADLAGAYVIQLIVNDGTEASAPDTVTITAN